MTRIEVRGWSVMGWTKVLPGIPTPRLIQATEGEAYFVPNDGPSKDRVPGVWYLHDDGYESPDGKYTRVRVVSIEE